MWNDAAPPPVPPVVEQAGGGANCTDKSLDTHQQQALAHLQQLFPEHAQHDLLRFLRARQWDADKASGMFQRHLQWRSEKLPIALEAVEMSLQRRRFYLACSDAEERPVIYISFSKFVHGKFDADEEIDAYIYFIEAEVVPKIRSNPNGHHTWTVIIDVCGVRAPPIEFISQLNRVFESNYPERLFKLVMFPVPWVVQQIIAGTLLFVDVDTRAKFGFVNSLDALAMEVGADPQQLLASSPDIQKTVESL